MKDDFFLIKMVNRPLTQWRNAVKAKFLVLMFFKRHSSISSSEEIFFGPDSFNLFIFFCVFLENIFKYMYLC